jgi:hypothetical protein
MQDIGKQWTVFINRVSQDAEKDDANIIQYSRFLRILEEYRVSALAKQEERELFM